MGWLQQAGYEGEHQHALAAPFQGEIQGLIVHRLNFDQVLAHQYGEIAHMNSGKRRRYRSWNDLPVFPLLEFSFSAVVTGLFCVIFNAAELARAE